MILASAALALAVYQLVVIAVGEERRKDAQDQREGQD